MAGLSFNPSRVRTPPLQPHQHISNFASFPNFTHLPHRTPRGLAKNQRLVHWFRLNSVSESSVSAEKQLELNEEEEGQEDDDPTAELRYLDPETDPESISEWELDFCSRPILDIRGKKVWELVVCDSSLSLQYTKYFPNNVINSITLKDAIVSVSDELGVPLPEKIRYFR